MKPARQFLAACAGVLVAVGLWLASSQHRVNDQNSTIVGLVLAVVALSAVVGWVAGNRWPGQWTGPLLQLSGMATGVGVLREIDLGRLGGAAAMMIWLSAPIFSALIIATHPDGFPSSRGRKGFVLCATGVSASAVAIGIHQAATRTGRVVDGSLYPVPVGVPILRAAHAAASVALLVVVLGAVRQRSRQLSPAERPFVRSVFVTGRVWVVATTVQLLTTQLPTRTLLQQQGYLRNWSAVVIDRIPLLSAGVLLGAVAFVSMIRPRLDRLPNGSMVIQSDPLSGLGPNLQRWLSDPTLRIAFAEADSTPTDWLDASGASHRPSAGNGRSTVIVRRDGRPIALIEHDSTVVTADAIRLAAQATASALDAHRQTAVAGSRVIRAQQLGGRLVTAEDDVRTQLAATLEDGPCRQLHDSAASLRTAPDLPIVVDVLQLAAADVRTISHGLFPTELLDGGLSAALPHIAGAPSRRLPRAMELTAFLVVGDERDATMDLTDDSLLIHRRSPLREPYVIDRITALDGMIDGNDVRLPCGAG